MEFFYFVRYSDVCKGSREAFFPLHQNQIYSDHGTVSHVIAQIVNMLYFIKHFSSSSSSDEDFENKENLAAKSKHTDWFDNHETDSDTSLDEKDVKIKTSGSPAQKLPKLAKSSSKVAKMAINGTSNKDQTSSSLDENTSVDEIKENAAKLELIQGKENSFCPLIYVCSRSESTKQ